MKVALALDRFDPGGGGLEKWTAQFAAFLIGRGHDVHVVAFAVVTDLAVTPHVLPPERSLPARAAAIERCLNDLGADAVYDTGVGWSGDVFHPHTGSQLFSLDREIASYPAYRRLKAALSPRTQLRRAQMAALERRQMRTAPAIIAVSARVRDMLVRRFDVPPGRIEVVRNGVDVSHFDRARIGGMRDEARRALGFPADTVVCLCSAHNLRLKGVDTAMAAVAALRREGVNVHLAVAGGKPDAAWQKRAAQAGGAATVTFLGQLGDMRQAYAAGDIYVHPTRWDACSLSTIEAGAAGVPVITTAINGASELIQDGITGFVLQDPEDAAALAARIRTLVDPARRRAMGLAASKASAGHDLRPNHLAVEAALIRAAQARSKRS